MKNPKVRTKPSNLFVKGVTALSFPLALQFSAGCTVTQQNMGKKDNEYKTPLLSNTKGNGINFEQTNGRKNALTIHSKLDALSKNKKKNKKKNILYEILDFVKKCEDIDVTTESIYVKKIFFKKSKEESMPLFKALLHLMRFPCAKPEYEILFSIFSKILSKVKKSDDLLCKDVKGKTIFGSVR